MTGDFDNVIRLPELLPIDKLTPHPDNPRFAPRAEIVDQIAAQLSSGGFDQAHALIVRPLNGGWQIISGHHRKLAAKKAGLTEIPCWVRDFDDETAYMLLVTANAQSELTPLERGRHALRSKKDVKAYAESVGRAKEYDTVRRERLAAEVAAVCNVANDENYIKLVEVHAAPAWLWPALVDAMIGGEWSVEQTRKKIAALGMKKGDLELPPYLDIAEGLVAGAVKVSDIQRVIRAERDMREEGERIERRLAEINAVLAKTDAARPAPVVRPELVNAAGAAPGEVPVIRRKFTKCADALEYLDTLLAPWRKALDAAEKAYRDRQRLVEEAQARAARLKEHCSLEEWKSLDAATRAQILSSEGVAATTFLKQDSNNIEWAMWSWNPITGCEHLCSYCVEGSTLVLTGDGSAVPIAALRAGDRIIGTRLEGHYRRLVETEVLAHWKTVKPAFEIELADGRKIVASGDHRFLTDRGLWKHASHQYSRLDAAGKLNHNTPNLLPGNSLLGFGPACGLLPESEEYREGYLSGVIRGDGHLKIHRSNVCSFRLAMNDVAAINRAERYLAMAGIATKRFGFAMAVNGQTIDAIRTSDELSFSIITATIAWKNTDEYRRGFLAGLFDAEGSNTGNKRASVLRIFNSDAEIIERFVDALSAFNFRHVLDIPKQTENKIVQTVRILGGLAEHIRFFQLCDPAIKRELKLEGAAVKNGQELDVVSVRSLGIEMPMFDITTGTEDFIANGVVAHNCYAREIATSSTRSSAFPNGFAPTLKPRSILAPRGMKVPKEAQFDARFKNVFLGSMADVFGRWVPREWIDAILAECRAAPEWNFLCLTKFPKRMAEFDVPSNVWMGTTVDLQVRVKAAEEAFANVRSKVRWLSCEPLLEPVRFQHLERFHWIVIGGASRTNKTPEWRPPYVWIRDLEKQARDAGLKVYFKDNLFGDNARILELPFDAPLKQDPTEAPAVFHYLKGTSAT